VRDSPKLEAALVVRSDADQRRLERDRGSQTSKLLHGERPRTLEPKRQDAHVRSALERKCIRFGQEEPKANRTRLFGGERRLESDGEYFAQLLARYAEPSRRGPMIDDVGSEIGRVSGDE
jgi:hypothetical protein